MSTLFAVSSEDPSVVNIRRLPELTRENQLKTVLPNRVLVTLVEIYKRCNINTDIKGFYSTQSNTLDIGSYKDVRLSLNHALITQQVSDLHVFSLEYIKQYYTSRSHKPRVIIVPGSFFPGDTGIGVVTHVPDPQTGLAREVNMDETSAHDASFPIIKDGRLIGQLMSVSRTYNSYRLYIPQNIFHDVICPTTDNIEGMVSVAQTDIDWSQFDEETNVSILFKRFFDDLDYCLERIEPVIMDRLNREDTTRMRLDTLLPFLNSEELKYKGYGVEFNLGEISKVKLEARIRDLHDERQSLNRRLANSSRNYSLALRELARFAVDDKLSLNVSQIKHPDIETAYIETLSRVPLQRRANYPVINIISKQMAFYPYKEPGEEDDRDPVVWNKEIGGPCGRFRIRIDFNTEDVVFFHSIDYPEGVNGYSENMHHPHIFSNNVPCWGNFGETLSDLITKIDIPGIIDLAFLFIRTINYDDAAGRNWPNWLGTYKYEDLYKAYEKRLAEEATKAKLDSDLIQITEVA